MTNRIFKRALANIKRSGWRAFAIIFMMTVTYFILGIQLIVMFMSQGLARYFVERPEIIGFFKDTTTEEQIQQVKTELATYDFVVDVRYVSKEDALRSFIEENKDDRETIEGITVNPFPAHLNVKVNSLDKVSTVAEYFRSNELVDSVNASEKVLDTLRKIVLAVQIFGLGLLTIFSFSTFVIIFLTIGLTIYSQKEELRVMKLVGASQWYIRAPYLVQSIIYSFIASLISTGILVVLLYLKLEALINSLLGQIQLASLTPLYMSLGLLILVAFSIMLSLLSSYVATRRYISN